MIVPQEIYHPLYEDKEKFIILITGGRGSGKSFNASTFIERLTFEMTPAEKIVHQILYTRYTMVSAGMSIIPEMMEKIDLDGTTKYFKFRFQSFFTRISHYKPSFIMLYGDVLFTPLYSREVVRRT